MKTIAAIENQIAKLTSQADRLRKAQARSVIQQIRQMIAEHALTPDELFGKAARQRVANGRSTAAEANGTSKKASRKTTKTAAASPARGPIGVALYRDPASGAEWTGRGRAPKWIAGHEDRAPFLIKATASKKRGAKQAAESM